MKFLIELGQGLVEGALIAVILYVMGINLTAVQIGIVVVSMAAISSVVGNITKALQKNKKQ